MSNAWALLSSTPAEMCLAAVLMRFSGVWFEYRRSMFRIQLSCSSRSVLDVLQRTFLKFVLVEIRYILGLNWWWIMGIRALPFHSILHGQAKVLPVGPTVVYRGRCCRKRGGLHRGLITREIRERFNGLASRSRLRLRYTPQEEIVIALGRGY